MRRIIILIFLLILSSTALRSGEYYKIACTVHFGGPGETLVKKYKVYDNYIHYYEAYNPVRNSRAFISRDDIYEIIKKTNDTITAVPKFSSIVDFVIINLETSMIYFYETEYSKPDLKNRVKEKTFISFKGKCYRD